MMQVTMNGLSLAS